MNPAAVGGDSSRRWEFDPWPIGDWSRLLQGQTKEVGWRPARRGVSLMEVLISIFVLAVGLLGLAALLPVGSVTIHETGKADRSGACGRAALREIKVRRILDPRFWSDTSPAAAGLPFAIDPLGPPGDLGPIKRITLNYLAGNKDLAEQIFECQDDLNFVLPENMKPPPDDDSDRPRGVWVGGGLQNKGDYSWFLTVTPAAAEVELPLEEKRLFSVSVVVCYKRVFSLDGEQPTTVQEFRGRGWGGGGVILSDEVEIRENEWIMLCDPNIGHCKWYRVISAGDSPTAHLSLAGPDWHVDASPNPSAVVIDNVIGVYSTTVEVDWNLLWTQ